MPMLLYPFLIHLLPFFLLFFMAIEVYVRNYSNRLHRISMLLFLSLSMLFFGDFLLYVLPLDAANVTSHYVKQMAIFTSMVMALYFFAQLSKISFRTWHIHLICAAPVVGNFVLLIQPGWASFEVKQAGSWRLEEYGLGYGILIAAVTLYTLFMLFILLYQARRRIRLSHTLMQERRRIGYVLKGSLFVCVSVIVAVVVMLVLKKQGILGFDFLSNYCVLIWAFTIRYAMVRFDFLSSAGRRYELLFELSQQGIVLLDKEGTIIEANATYIRFAKLLGYSGGGHSVGDVLQHDSRDHFMRLYRESFRTVTPIRTELELKTAAGRVYTVEVNGDYLEFDGQLHCFLVARDITAEKQNERMLSKFAYEDSLTGLGNRRYFTDNMQLALSQLEKEQASLALMLIDLDQFKWINDTLGHSAGDQLLRHVAHQLMVVLPPAGIVARLGGDEFAIALTGANGPEEAVAAAKNIMSALELPIQIGRNSYTVTASIGISLAPRDGLDSETLLRNADIAMYEAKESGRNQYHVFTPEMQAKADRHLMLVNGLTNALERGELSLVYQPQIDIHRNKVYGAEALLRWSSAELGAISPSTFIPIAEETGLIVPIGEWVLEQAIQQAKAWIEQGSDQLVISVNLSALQLRVPGIARRIAGILEEYGVPPENLCLEITESTAISDFDNSLQVCRELMELGISLSIDDFGMGYSSLSMLNRFPFRFIKIDRSLVQDIADSQRDLDIIRTVVELSCHLGMQVVAEGVETAEQLRLLQYLGCHEVQGYYFGKPMSADLLTEYLSSWPRKVERVEELPSTASPYYHI
jgi:diguanylate cyclase (GGDEF)-like protein/PAS domain S-box-containing protein